MELPAVQRKILVALCESLSRYGELPTLPALSRSVGLQATAVQYHLEALRHKGFVRRDLTTWGGVTVECEALKEEYAGVQAEGPAAVQEASIGLPLAGDIAAGIPIATDQGIEEHLGVPAGLVPSGVDSFVLKVRGDSMKDAGILDGDLVVVRRQETADEGDIVAALVDGEATIKRFSRQEGEALLLPANPTYEPIDAKQASILGKVVTVLRLEPRLRA
jgi:repressor LexA